MTVNLDEVETPTETMNFRFEGKSPLLQNKWTDSAIEEIDKYTKGHKTKEVEPSNPEEEVHQKYYSFQKDGEEVYAVNGTAVLQCLARAAINFDLAHGTKIRSTVTIERDHGELIELESPDPEVHKSVGEANGSPMTIYRPKFWPWAIEFGCHFNPSVISVENFVRMCKLAGEHVGLGSWRPQNAGPFGDFTVADAELIVTDRTKSDIS